MSVGALPVVDISEFATGSPSARRAIAAAVDEAYRSIGFLEISGHGIDQQLIDTMMAITTEYFDQPFELKLDDVMPAGTNRGYSPPGTEALSYSLGLETPPDLFQAFNAGAQVHTIDPQDRPPDHASLYAENHWPSQPAEMQRVWKEYIAAVFDLGQRMLRILAVSLDLDEEYFASRAEESPAALRALDYRSEADSPPFEPGQLRLGAHSDYGMCTMLYADSVPGLQLLGPDDQWHDVTPTAGHYVINIGDMLAAWTNDRWRSTVHRVVPAAPGQPMHRRSLAFFHEANPDAMIDPLDCCVSADNPPRYERISAGDHLRQKISSGQGMEKADTVQTTDDRRDALLTPAKENA